MEKIIRLDSENGVALNSFSGKIILHFKTMKAINARIMVTFDRNIGEGNFGVPSPIHFMKKIIKLWEQE